MSLKEKRSELQFGLEQMERLMQSLRYAAPELWHAKLGDLEEVRSRLFQQVLALEAPPKTAEEKLAELRAALRIDAGEDHEDALSYARDQAQQASLYRDIRDIVGDREVPF